MHLPSGQPDAPTNAVSWLVDIAQWRDWLGACNRLPMIGTCGGEELPAQWTAAWRPGQVSALLETGKNGRYTILGNNLRGRLSGDAGGAVVWEERIDGEPDREAVRLGGPPLAVLDGWLGQRRLPPVAGGPPFYGGLIGYLAYDAGETLETLHLTEKPPLPYPWYLWAELEEGWVFDHETRTLACFSLCRTDGGRPETGSPDTAFAAARERVVRLFEKWRRWRNESVPPPPPESPAVLAPDYHSRAPTRLSMDRRAFVAAVRAAQQRIAAGETYQVNLSVRQSRPLTAPPERIYEALRRLNPSPYMALLRFPEVTIVSGSPELLLGVRGGRLETHPIAATRPRGATPGDDAALAAELLSNPKERAEHLMLVDLLRNDIGRVAEFGSVNVRDFMSIERYSHVMHLVSRIEGTLARGRTACDAFGSLFPGGTITGAPKVRTMQIIGNLEPVRRGIYTGAIGWLGYNGDAMLNIAIRTLEAFGGQAHVQSGAGIVADSDPAQEFEESINKSRALWLAMERASTESGAHV